MPNKNKGNNNNWNNNNGNNNNNNQNNQNNNNQNNNNQNNKNNQKKQNNQNNQNNQPKVINFNEMNEKMTKLVKALKGHPYFINVLQDPNLLASVLNNTTYIKNKLLELNPDVIKQELDELGQQQFINLLGVEQTNIRNYTAIGSSLNRTSDVLSDKQIEELSEFLKYIPKKDNDTEIIQEFFTSSPGLYSLYVKYVARYGETVLYILFQLIISIIIGYVNYETFLGKVGNSVIPVITIGYILVEKAGYILNSVKILANDIWFKTKNDKILFDKVYKRIITHTPDHPFINDLDKNKLLLKDIISIGVYCINESKDENTGINDHMIDNMINKHLNRKPIAQVAHHANGQMVTTM